MRQGQHTNEVEVILTDMARHTKPQHTFCTTREAAEMLGISLKTAQLWAESGLLEAWRTEGGHRRIYRTSVERLLASGGVKPNPSELASKHSKNISILVAEDDRILRKLYDIRLRTWPIQPAVKVVGSGIEALLEIGKHPPDLFITDLKMPQMDGFEVIRTLRDMPDLTRTTIVVVTGLDDADIKDKGGIPVGIKVFPKPVPFDALEKLANEIAAGSASSLKVM